MIEREFVEQKKKEFQIQEFVSESLKNAGHSHTKLQRTPLGEKVVIYTSRPGLIVGRKGQTISKLTEVLKKKFGLENPQVEIAEVSNPNLDARIVAERIASELERFGSNRFKGVMHKVLEDVMSSGAVGVEIRLSGKLPGARAKSWRIAAGYLRKCGDAAITFVNTSKLHAQLKPGVIGIKVSIMPPGVIMPDQITMREQAAPAQPEKAPEIITEAAAETITEQPAEKVAEPAAEAEAPKPKKQQRNSADGGMRKSRIDGIAQSAAADLRNRAQPDLRLGKKAAPKPKKKPTEEPAAEVKEEKNESVEGA